jgi:hypothetical protein
LQGVSGPAKRYDTIIIQELFVMAFISLFRQRAIAGFGLFLFCLSLPGADAVEDLKVEKGFPLATENRVPDHVIVNSVLIPPKDAARMFGNAVAKTHAVVQIIVANQSKDQAFILKSLAIDYSRWLLSNCDTRNTKEIDGDPQYNKALLEASDAYGKPCRVASVEVNAMWLVTKDGANKDWRNWVYRALVGAGVITGAGGIAFEATQDLIRGVTAWNSAVPPSFRSIFPDRSLDHLNFLQSSGFRTNTVVPKSAAVSVYAFFPIRRFIGAKLGDMYLKEPALFFSPQQYLADKQYDKFFKLLIARFGVANRRQAPRLDSNVSQDPADVERRAKDIERVHEASRAGEPENAIDPDLNINTNESLRAILSQITLNRISIVAGGEMVIGVSELSPKIEAITLSGVDFGLSFKGAKFQANLKGKQLEDATYTMTGAKATIKVKKQSDTTAELEVTLEEAIEPFKTVLEFKASQKVGTQTLESKPFQIAVGYDRPTPKVNSVEVKVADIKASGFRVEGTDLTEGKVDAKLVGAKEIGLKLKKAARDHLEFEKVEVEKGTYVLQLLLDGKTVALGSVKVVE